MLKFKTIEPDDKSWIDELLKISDFRGCEYNFTNNFVWRNIYDVTICRYKDFYIVKQGEQFIFPAGKGNVDELIAELSAYCKENGTQLYFSSMDKATKEMLEKKYGSQFTFTFDEGYFDYIYESEALRTLAGKKLHSKRNYINRFKALNWSFEDITEDNISECCEMSSRWCELNNCEENSDKAEEICAVSAGLQYFKELQLCGGILRVNGAIQAFSYGERLNSDTYVTHVEKAFTEFDGTYPMINYLMANRFCADVKYINREEDMGEENLRKAKRSYRPVFMHEKFRAEYNG